MCPLLPILAALGYGIVVQSTVYLIELYTWQRHLCAYRLDLPRSLTLDDAVRWFGSLAAMTHPPRWSLVRLPPLVLEVQANDHGIQHFLVVAPSMKALLFAGLQANFPGARLEAVPGYTPHHRRMSVAHEFAMTDRTRPLAFEHAEAASTGLLAALQPLLAEESLVVQLLLTSAGTPAPVSSGSSDKGASTPTWFAGSARIDPESLRAQRIKQKVPLFAAVLRLGADAPTRQSTEKLLSRPSSMVQGMNAPGVRLVKRFVPSFITVWRIQWRAYPWFRWPLLLNTRELAGLVAFPYGAYLPGLTLGRSRQLPPSPNMPTRGNIVGESDYPGTDGRTLALSTADRLHHVHLIGPTGTGKSTLLARMAVQDIAGGYGVVVIDPKGDLVQDIAARIPEHRLADVVVLDPSESQSYIVGFNPLRGIPGDSSTRELIADNVLSIFHSLYRDFWGPRTDEVLRAALFSLTHTHAPDGSAFTLIEVPELLTNPALRHYVTAQDSLPPYLRAFWQWFDTSLKDKDRTEAIGPVMNKLRAFSMRSSIRLMLGQSQGIALDEIINRNGILLISLAKGKIGSEAASLLGSLFVSSLWQAAQARIRHSPEQRRPFFAYLDEFQDIVRVGADTNLADMLAQARGLGVSVTLAHQYLSQLPMPVREATLSTVRTHIAFQLEWDDARALEGRFAPLTRDDLSGLDAHEFAMKPCVDGQTLTPVTGRTLPLGEPLQVAHILARLSRERHSMARAAVEAGLQARLGVSDSTAGTRFGREQRGAAA